MVIMAGMLPGVECSRRRRMRQGGDAGVSVGVGTRRSSFCLYTAGHVAPPCGAGNPSKQKSSVMELINGLTLDSNAREAKERLDHKLRTQRQRDNNAIKRHHSTGSMTTSKAKGGATAAAAAAGVQREVYSKKGVMRRLMRWSRLRWDAAEQAECAVCLEEFAAGDVLAHLPCGHRFHWGCALPWLEAGAGASSSRSCPFCRAAVDAAAAACVA